MSGRRGDPLLLSLDLGTTGIKAMVLDTSGSILAQVYQQIDLDTDESGRAEQDARVWRDTAWRLIAACVRQIGARQADLTALAISSQGISFVPVDAHNQPLRPALSWLDNRAGAEADELVKTFGAPLLFRRTGKRINPAYTLPKLLWLRRHEPELYAQADAFLLPHDYLAACLTGRRATDDSLASGTMLFDIRRRDWDDELLQFAGLRRGQLAAAGRAGRPLGRLLPEVAAELGLPRDLLLVCGAQDQKCALVGADVRSGLLGLSLGTAAAVSCFTDQPPEDAQMRIPGFAFLDRWVAEAVISTAGLSLRWLRDRLFPQLSYAEMDQLAATALPGSGGVLFYPYLAGAGTPWWDSQAKANFSGLTLATGRADLIRAVLEGVACEVRMNLDSLRGLSATPITELRAFGGGAASPLWLEILAGVTGLPVRAPRNREMAHLGAAALAAVGAGLFPDETAALTQMTGAMDLYIPQHTDRYEQLLADYQTNRVKSRSSATPP